MRIFKGIVKRNGSFTKDGIFWVKVAEKRSLIKVTYVSPYGGRASHGLIPGIPEIDDTVLICQSDNSKHSEWFYLGSVWETNLTEGRVSSHFTKGAKTDDPEAPLYGPFPDKNIYRSRGVPQRMVWRSPRGNKLILSDEENERRHNVYIKLRSTKGKKLILNDSPGIDAVLLRNEHGDGLTIQNNWVRSHAPRLIQLRSKGPIRLISHEGGILLKVYDGNPINIINKGRSKVNKFQPQPGNINLESVWNDINLTVKSAGKDNAINIFAEGDRGQINVITKGGESVINLESGGDVNIDGENINITAKDSINLKAKEE